MIVYGKQIVFYILEKHPKIIKQIFLTKEIDKKLFKKFMDVGAKIVRPDNMKAQALAKGGNHQGFLLDIDELEYAQIKDVKKSDFIVVLDGLSDVGNIGAIVRSSYAMGVDAIVICGLKNFYAAPIVRTSSGAMLDMPIAISYSSYDLANELKQQTMERKEITMKTNLSKLPRVRDVYITMLPGDDFKKVANKAIELVNLGFNPVPHFPARSIKNLSLFNFIFLRNVFNINLLA